jgi:hypothetical protein
VIVVTSVPHHHYLVDGYVTTLPVFVSQVEYPTFNFEYLAAQARSAATENVELPAYVSG